jgi:hypothetical protein
MITRNGMPALGLATLLTTTLLTTTLLTLYGTLIVAAQPPAGAVDYSRDIRPILVSHCYRCHSQVKQEASLRVDRVEHLLEGGDRGPAIVPGKSGASLLIQAVRHENDLQMPLDGERLSDEQIAALSRWIDGGASAGAAQESDEHWAFQQPRKADLPAADDPDGSSHPIDRLVAAAHRSQGLTPVALAPPEIQLRRLYLDLVGLPPTAEELAAFQNDHSDDAYQRVVDQLLASPRYGERWGRHWMDVWRYADWSGYQQEIRYSQPHIWRWRDWIVESLNQDKPYDAMLLEMLAGDELAPADPDVLRATGFLVRNWYKFNRNTWLESTVEHTGKAFLGLTINCAKCHDHMYDPISQEEYYRFRAFFETHDVRTDPVAGQLDTKQDGLPRVYDAQLQAPTYLFVRGDERKPDKERELQAALPQFLGADLEIQPLALSPGAYYPGLAPQVQERTLAAAREQLATARKALETADQNLAAARKQADAASSEAVVAPTTAADPWLHDDFSDGDLPRWTIVSGQWSHENGRLVQRRTGASEFRLDAKGHPPADFVARLRFRILGGEQWKSVGLTFDQSASGDGECVYVSAYAGGPKIQISHKSQGQSTYPETGKHDYPIKLDEVCLLEIRLRGTLLNVLVNDQFQMAYRLPHERRGGSIAVWAFDAISEFQEIQVTPLAADQKLVALDGEAVDNPALRLADATAVQEIAQKKVAAGEAAVASVAARILADNARYADPPQPDAATRTQDAARAERHHAQLDAAWAVQDAEYKQRRADRALAAGPEDQKLKKAAADAAKAVEQAQDKARQAEEAWQEFDPQAASYTPLSEVYPQQSSGRRLALARWIADSQNPLTARVAVNHMWLRHFAAPLVPRVDDFGLSSPRPALGDLLDWLAVELVESGWRMKHMHRLMVTSRLYRSQSWPESADSANLRIDPDNEWLWRMNPKRMESELIRDSILYVAGRLDLTLGGPDLDHNLGLSTYRRSIYYRHAYEKQMLLMRIFDTAGVEECYRRSHSVMPQQALALANSPLALSSARVLARNLLEQLPPPAEAGHAKQVDAERMQRLFVLVLGRTATPEEIEACRRFLDQQSQTLAEPEKLTRFVASAEEPDVKASADPRIRAWEDLAHVLLNHNDFITIR